MSFEPWPPLHKRPNFRFRLIWLAVLLVLVIVVARNLLHELL